LLEGLRAIPKPWGLAGEPGPKAPDPGRELIASVSLTGHLGKGIRGEVVYQFRRPFRDEGAADDFLSLSFNPERVLYQVLADHVFDQYVTTFGAYRGEVGDVAFTHKDCDAARNVDFRNGVFRINPISFFDPLLCRRAFRLEPEDVASRLMGLCERVSLENDGVLIVATRQALKYEDADRLSRQLMDAVSSPV
jgi:hypothetical protein